MTNSRDYPAEGEEIKAVGWDRSKTLEGSVPPAGFTTYTPRRVEKFIGAWSKTEKERSVVGPVFVQDPSRERIGSVVIISDNSDGYGGRERGSELMYIADGALRWFPQSSSAERSSLELRHSFARDVESDQSKLVSLDLASVSVVSMDGTRVELDAWVVGGAYYAEGDSGALGAGADSIFDAVKGDTDADPYADSKYPYMPPSKDGILGRTFPFRVRITQYGAEYKPGKIFKKAAGL